MQAYVASPYKGGGGLDSSTRRAAKLFGATEAELAEASRRAA